MKKYIKENLEPILIGIVIAFIFIYFFNTIHDLIISIALINKDNA